MNRLFKLLNRESSGLHQAAYILGSFALLSQLLAFMRDRLLAHLFGASSELDIYYAAFRIPDFLFVSVASVVSISVLVPFVIERAAKSKEEVKEFVDNMFSFFALIMVSASVAAFFFMPYLSKILFKGFDPGMLKEVVLVSRVMLVSPIALGLSNLLGSLTQAYNRFTTYALAPILYNVGIILGIIVLGQDLGPLGVGAGVAIGALMHALVQVPFVWHLGLFPRFKVSIDLPLTKGVVFLSLPRTLALSTNQLTLLFLISFASLMSAGSISILSLAINLQSVPLAIIGVSYSLAAFPTLSKHFSDKNMTAFIEQMSNTARHVVFWVLPLTTLFVVLRAQIVRVLLGSGEFDWNDTRLTAAALALFVVSAVFQSLLMLFMRGFYSAGRTKEPFVINLLSTFFLIFAAYALVKVFYGSSVFRSFIGDLLRVGDLANSAVLMLPLAYSLGTALNALLHWYWFERNFKGFSKDVYMSFLKSFSTSVIVGAVAYVGLDIFSTVFDTTRVWGIFLEGLAAGALASLVGVGVLYVLRSRELGEVWLALRTKVRRRRVIATDPEIV